MESGGVADVVEGRRRGGRDAFACADSCADACARSRSDTDANSGSDAYANSDTNPNANANANANADADADADAVRMLYGVVGESGLRSAEHTRDVQRA